MKPHYIILPLLFFISIKSGISQSAVRAATTYTTTTATTLSQAFGSASTTGNLIVVELDWGDATHTVSSVTDNKGNTYKQIPFAFTKWNSNAWSADLWYAYNITGGAVLTVKATFSAAPSNFYQIYIDEFSGILSSSDPLDQASSAFGNTTPASSGSKTTGASSEMIYGSLIGSNGNTTTGATFTNVTTANQNIIEYKTSGATMASYDANFTVSNTPANFWVAQMATFQTSSSVVLPIGLVDFTAQCNANNVVINWTTASEIDNNYFTIERSKDASEFNSIGTIKGAGNSSDNINYSFTDTNPLAGEGYYRLKQTDYNGNSTTFNIVATDCEPVVAPVFLHYNNQAGTITIDINSDMSAEYISCIYDEQGRRVSIHQFYHDKENKDYSIDVSSLRTGIYFMSLESAGNRTTQKFLIR